MSEEEGQEVKVGRSEVNRPLNRFRNITACKIKLALPVVYPRPQAGRPSLEVRYLNMVVIDHGWLLNIGSSSLPMKHIPSTVTV